MCVLSGGSSFDLRPFTDADKARLLEARDAIAEFMRDTLGLHMHTGKTRLQPVSHGIDFVGWRLMPHRRYLRRRTANQATANIRALADAPPGDIRATVNSYCGLACHGTTWNLRGKWLRLTTPHPQLVGVPDRSKVLLRKESSCLTTPA